MTAASAQRRSSRIIVVEDEPDIAALIAYQLTRAGFRVETASTGQEGLAAINRELPDLVVLDRMLPGLSGDEILAQLRQDPTTLGLPVLLLTAKREQEDRIHGLELGADDYLTKPFSPRELVLRVEAILRRIQERSVVTGGKILRAGALTLDVSSHQVTLDGEELSLTPTEFKLLSALMEPPGHTRSRTQLLQNVWGFEADVSGRIQTRTVDMHVRRLRDKLGPMGESIETVRGFGYRLRTPDEGG